MDEQRDRDRMLAVRAGDVEQLGPIFERYSGRLYNYFLRLTGDPHTSEDLVQDTFCRVLRSRRTFRGDGRFSTWLFAVGRSAFFTNRRKHARQGHVVELPESLEHGGLRPDERAERRQEARRLREALSRLSDEKREALVLSRFEGMKLEEIAEVAGCAVGTVKARVHRALKDLSRIYRELGDDVRGMSEESA